MGCTVHAYTHSHSWLHMNTLHVRSKTNIYTARRHASAICAVVVCLSVCHTPALYQNGKTEDHAIAPHDNPWNLVFWRQRPWRNSNGITPNGDAKAGGVGYNRRLSTNNNWYNRYSKAVQTDALFLLKSNRKSYTLYRMVRLPIPWMTPNLPNPNFYILRCFLCLRSGRT